MSQKGAESAQNPPPLETVESVSATVKGQKTLILAILGLCVVSLLCAAFAILMSMSGGEHETLEVATLPQDTQVRRLEARSEEVSHNIEELLNQTQQTRSELEALSMQVAAIDVNDERNVIIRMQRLLIKQEQDFQAFVGSLESGMYNFHMMVPRSGGWWEQYKTELDAMTEKSKARENYASTLRDN